jgi:pyruvate/2-oxoglutarate dehydrogenase complex dihydrolipoamide dehydrogenase (E3) component
MTSCDVLIIGAGPYGLSAAAHLSTLKGLEVRAFGEPMEFWANKMPAGMLLRSPRAASTIADPRSEFTLEAYEAASGTIPVSRVARETFVDYGKWFHAKLGSILDRRGVVQVRREGSIFKATLSDGSVLSSRYVVAAAGVGPFKKNPEVFSDLSPTRASHCYEGRKLTDLGKRVAVIGAGQSALESAALLREAGTEVEVIARISTLRWIGMHKRLHQLGIISRVLYSKHDIGPIGISRLVAYPKLMFHVPMGIKDPIRTRAVRSAGAPWLIPRLTDVKISTGRSVRTAKEIGGEVQLILDDGSERRVDHVLLGTGYRVDISKYGFLSPDLVREVRLLDGYPELAAGFTTSVPGLHFIGATAARNFGPLLYFVTGTEFASRELLSHFTRSRAPHGVS